MAFERAGPAARDPNRPRARQRPNKERGRRASAQPTRPLRAIFIHLKAHSNDGTRRAGPNWRQLWNPFGWSGGRVARGPRRPSPPPRPAPARSVQETNHYMSRQQPGIWLIMGANASEASGAAPSLTAVPDWDARFGIAVAGRRTSFCWDQTALIESGRSIEWDYLRFRWIKERRGYICSDPEYKNHTTLCTTFTPVLRRATLKAQATSQPRQGSPQLSQGSRCPIGCRQRATTTDLPRDSRPSRRSLLVPPLSAVVGARPL